MGRYLRLLTLLVAACAAVGPVAAQEQYELGEEGFERVEVPDPDTPEGMLHAIRQALADERPREAEKLADRWIEEYPNHPRLAEAHLLRGDARASRRHYYRALYDYEVVLRGHPDSEHFHAALERELKIAEAFGRGVRRRLWGMRILPAYGEAEELLIRIQERAPGSRIAERAGIELGDFYYRRSEMMNAAEAYDLFLENYPDSPWREHAMRRQVLANLATFRGPEYDATGLIEAQRRLADYRETYPAAAEQMGAEALTTRIEETLAVRSFEVARWYERRGQEVEAAYMYRRVLRDHAGTAAAQRAARRLERVAPPTAARETAAPPPQEEPAPVERDGS